MWLGMVGVKDTAVLVELAKRGGWLPLSVEKPEVGFPVCFHRVVTDVYNVQGNNGSKTRRLRQICTILVNNAYIRRVRSLDSGKLGGAEIVYLTEKGRGVVGGVNEKKK